MDHNLEGETSIAETVRSEILGSEDRIWKRSDFSGNQNAVQAELGRLLKAGEIERVRRGVYWRGRKTRWGHRSANESDVLRDLIGAREAIGATGWLATNLLGLSTQVPRVETFAVSTRPPTGFKRLRFVDRSQRYARRDQQLNETEVALLEALEGWDRFVEVPAGDAVKRFVEALESEHVRQDRLVAACETEPAVVRQRLKVLLESARRSEIADSIEPAHAVTSIERAMAVFPSGNRA